MDKPSEPTTIYIDGSCSFCNRHATWLCGRKGGGELRVVDISHPRFLAEEHGLQTEKVNRQLHVRQADGKVLVGWEAVLETLRATGSGGWTKVFLLPGIRQLLSMVYRWIARNRLRWGNFLQNRNTRR